MATENLPLMPHLTEATAMENAVANAAVPLQFIRFPQDRQTEAIFQFMAPSNYASGATLNLIYDTEDGEAGDIRMTAEVMAVSDGEAANVASFDTANVTTDTVEATVGETNLDTIALTNADSMADDDLVLVRLRRTPAHADDTVDADMRLFAIDLEFTIGP
ncbi:MAG TPA: hypothetical protein VFC82_11235 [Actinomycetaceae bacterium]|nr:hypothetical protein [Actinomycetaceae bacterium]